MSPLRSLSALCAVAVIAAGCTTAGDAADGGSEAEVVEESTTSAPAVTAEEPTVTSNAPVELTASFRGVTEDTIKVGVVAIDFNELAEFGVEQNRGDSGAMLTAVVEAINDRGGILGRQLEVTTQRYVPVGGVGAEETCLQLTEDTEVFVAVGAIRNDDVLCYTELHETAVIAVSNQTQERIDRSAAPYVTVHGRTDTAASDWAVAMAATGVMDGRTVGVLGFDGALFESTVAALREEGVEPIEGVLPASGGDPVFLEAAFETVLERFQSEGVEVTVSASSIAEGFVTSAERGYETTWLQTPLLPPATLAAQGLDQAYLDGMLSVAPTSVGTVDQLTMGDDPEVVACIDTIESRTDEAVDLGLDPAVNNLSSAINACAVAQILELGLTAAGPELTNESFAAGLASLGDLSLAGFPSASLGPDDFAAAEGGSTVRYSAADGVWVLEG